MKRLLLLALILFLLLPGPGCRTIQCDDKLKPSQKARMTARLQRKKDRAYKREMRKKKRQGKYTAQYVHVLLIKSSC
ncbi:MAG: hypothetical protein AB1458_05790 [Bacteroidota bacterium]